MIMNRWTNKYSYGPGGGANAPARVAGGRLRMVLLVTLTIAVLVLGVVGGSAIAYRGKCDPTFIYTMQEECDEASGAMPGLSRSRGGNSGDYATLSRIRSCVSSIEAINEIRNTLEGGNGYYVEPAVFTNIYSIINSYYSNLNLGQEVVADWDNLSEALKALSAQLYSLD